MRTETWLHTATQELQAAGIGSARLDCLIILEDVSGRDRAWSLARPEHELDDSLLAGLDKRIKRRATHEPLAYIRGKTEFYGRQFYVDKRVLEPRPESETMIELLKGLDNIRKIDVPRPAKAAGKLTIVDIGTGSGALAITAKLELADAAVYATDIDPGCLEVARMNALDLHADVTFLEADLLSGDGASADSKHAALQQADIILANLPYVPDSHTINQAAMHEPELAIFGGPDGLNPYRQLVAQIRSFPSKPQYILTESLPPQHTALTEIFSVAGYAQMHKQDFIQVFYLT